MFLIFLIPGALTYTFGKMVGDTRQGWAIFAAFSVMFLVGVFVCYHFEQAGNPILAKLGIETAATAGQAGGNMEGKEVRFGIANSALFATVTTDASCGAVNSMHDSFTPHRRAGAAVQHHDRRGDLRRRRRGPVRHPAVLHPGGVHRRPDGRPHAGVSRQEDRAEGSQDGDAGRDRDRVQHPGLHGAQLGDPFPEKGYWNPPGAAIANLNNSGPHGFSEILYAYASGTGNNGSAFGGLNANTPWYNLTHRARDADRPLPVPDSAARGGGSLAAKKKIPATSGTFPTHGRCSSGLLVGTVVIVGALTFFPALSLGPIVEHLPDAQRKLFSMHAADVWS